MDPWIAMNQTGRGLFLPRVILRPSKSRIIVRGWLNLPLFGVQAKSFLATKRLMGLRRANPRYWEFLATFDFIIRVWPFNDVQSILM